ncbi:hypothetical protein H072_9768 [Dactylellina haptotyla CBS 200.50]|uniref:Malate dehydrogenase n=1 Tax=Dactylellina haptotyla (strain CBS 200.50) TaxID=1284197 RepID=S8BN51_DACHA|nr:hypothetical protein H072_9768 [Dactylellina haptotyla CBS 200.50]
MHFTNLFTVALLGASAVLAAPTAFSKMTNCNVSGIKLADRKVLITDPNNSTNALPPPTTAEGKLFKIALGVGTQNFSCAAAGSDPVSNGAYAILYDFSCIFLANEDAAKTLGDLAAQMKPDALNIFMKMTQNMLNVQYPIGKHFFKGDFTTPAFEFIDGQKFYGGVAGKVPAPAGSYAGQNGLGAVPSLKLTPKAGMGSTITTVYRIHTAGGVGPAKCDRPGIKQFPYSAEYWFYKA